MTFGTACIYSFIVLSLYIRQCIYWSRGFDCYIFVMHVERTIRAHATCLRLVFSF